MKKTFAALAASAVVFTSVIAAPVTTEASTEASTAVSDSALSSAKIKSLILAKLATEQTEIEKGEKSEKKVKLSGFTQKYDPVKPPTKQELDARTGLDSNQDDERRSALEKKYKIKLTDSMVWADKKGQTSVGPDGIVSTYTSHDELKSLGIYTINANRQELIQYGIQTGDWQPYRAFEAERTPGYYKVVNGKYEYTKVYYANQLANYRSWLGETETDFYTGKISAERHEELKAAYTRDFNEALSNFKKAPGVVPYIIGINNTSDLSEKYGVAESDFAFFDGVNNHDFMQGFISEEDIRASKTKEN